MPAMSRPPGSRAFETVLLPAREVDERAGRDRRALFARPHEAGAGENGDGLFVVVKMLGGARKGIAPMNWVMVAHPTRSSTMSW